MVTGARNLPHGFSEDRSGEGRPAGRIAPVRTRSSWTAWGAALALALVPAVYLINEVRTFYIDVPYWDEWSLAPLMWRQAAGESIPLAELAAFHNEHRPLLQAPDRRERIAKLLEQRRPLYEAIPDRVDTTGRTADEVAEEVLGIFERRTSNI